MARVRSPNRDKAFEIYKNYAGNIDLVEIANILNISPGTIQYAAIIRAQKIMYVTDKEEMIKELKKEESSEYGQKTEWEFQFAWDRQASFLNAQSRAMGELRSLIKQYDSMINANWDLVTEEQKNRIEKLKLEISNIRGDSKDNSTENWVNSIKAIAEKRKSERK